MYSWARGFYKIQQDINSSDKSREMSQSLANNWPDIFYWWEIWRTCTPKQQMNIFCIKKDLNNTSNVRLCWSIAFYRAQIDVGNTDLNTEKAYRSLFKVPSVQKKRWLRRGSNVNPYITPGVEPNDDVEWTLATCIHHNDAKNGWDHPDEVKRLEIPLKIWQCCVEGRRSTHYWRRSCSDIESKVSSMIAYFTAHVVANIIELLLQTLAALRTTPFH